jgi:hypothetical protein
VNDVQNAIQSRPKTGPNHRRLRASEGTTAATTKEEKMSRPKMERETRGLSFAIASEG